MLHIHKWSKWKTVRKECVEQQGGVLVPYSIQEKYCEKCRKVKIAVSEVSWELLSGNKEQYGER